MLTLKELCAMQDHSPLGHIFPNEEIKKWADEVLDYGFRSLCVNGDKIEYVKSYFEGRAKISAVISFPQGAGTKEAKIFEAVDAIKKGADDIDVVVNFSRMRNGEYSYVKEEIADIVKAAKDANPNTVTKFIVFMPYDATNPLRPTTDELTRFGEYIMEGKGDYFKYFTEHDFVVERFAKEIKEGSLKLKRCGTQSVEEMLKCVEQGVSIFGTDEFPKMLKAAPAGLLG